MPDDDYSQCPRCKELTEAGDHFPCADGTAYHVLCYQAAMLDAGQPNPFPLCDYCEQLVWELTGPGELVVKGLTMENGDWRPARWHVECAPGEESPRAVKDRVDEPPPQPQPHAIEVTVAAPTKRKHKRKAAGPADPTEGIVSLITRTLGADAKGRQLCVDCSKRIKPSEDGVEPIECEFDGGIVHYHKRCYRRLAIAAGQADPFPPPTKQILVHCSHCDGDVPREGFRQHVAEHEASNWAGR